MLSNERCKEILNKKEKKYTDEQVQQIKDVLYQLAKADVELFKRLRNENREKSNPVQ
jgi:hypothetical protein